MFWTFSMLALLGDMYGFAAPPFAVCAFVDGKACRAKLPYRWYNHYQ